MGKKENIVTWLLALLLIISMGIDASALNLSSSGGGSWQYYKVIIIRENSGSNLTEYQVLVQLSGNNFPTHTQSDGADIRFTDMNENELDYWIENWNYTGRNVLLWVKVPNIPANSNTIIRMYYGNSNATAVGSGDNTFDFFDDFKGTSIDGTKWYINNGTPSISDGILSLSDESVVSEKARAFGYNYIFESRSKISDTGKEPRSFLRSTNDYAIIDGSDRFEFGSWVNVNGMTLTNVNDGIFNLVNNTAEKFPISFEILGMARLTTKTEAFRQYASKLTNINNIPNSSLYFQLYSWEGETLFADWARIRKYTTSEPVASPSTFVVDITSGETYSKIQDAINNATAGDTIEVNNGTYYENVDVTKRLTLRGIKVGNDLPIIDAMGKDSAITITADGVTLEGFNVTNSSAYRQAGIKINSNYNTIKSNIASYNMYGILLDGSNYNVLSFNNLILNNESGLRLEDSNNNTLDFNSVNFTTSFGMFFYNSKFNTINNNTISNNENTFGIYLNEFSNNNNLKYNKLSKNGGGIGLESSSNNHFVSNTIESNKWDGLLFFNGSNNNNLSENYVKNNDIGVNLTNSSNTYVFYNNFIDNRYQAIDKTGANHWDRGYPTGGNYWGDYIGNDLKNGPNQDQPGSDGISDSPYSISGEAGVQDRYPFIKESGWITPEVPAPTPTPTASPTPNSGSSGGGGGGGGGGSGENSSNIVVKEQYDEMIYKDKETEFKFKDERSIVRALKITGNINAGLINAFVETLKGTSTLVNESPPGIPYKNFNAFVGTFGFAVPKNIKEARILVRVEKSWLSANNIKSEDMKVVRWDGSKWNELETRHDMPDDDKYHYCEAVTNTFSSFAVIGIKSVPPTVLPTKTVVVTPTPKVTSTTDVSPSRYLNSILYVLLVIVIVVIIVLKKKEICEWVERKINAPK